MDNPPPSVYMTEGVFLPTFLHQDPRAGHADRDSAVEGIQRKEKTGAILETRQDFTRNYLPRIQESGTLQALGMVDV